MTSQSHSSWDERTPILSRLVGALACHGDVDILSATRGIDERRQRSEGAAVRLDFPMEASDLRRLNAVHLLAFGPPRERPDCWCLGQARHELASMVPDTLEREYLRLSGESQQLLDHLDKTDYDAVLICGVGDQLTLEAFDVTSSSTPTAIVPLTTGKPALYLPAVRRYLAAAGAVVATTEFERDLLVAAGARPEAATVLGSVFRVHDLAWKNEPLMFEENAVVAIRDWAAQPASPSLLVTVKRLNADLAGRGVVRLVGPGWENLPDEARSPHAESRFDCWRWLTRSVAIWEPRPELLLAREVLEAFQYGTPAITTWSGAAQLHADRANGGLWYRSYEELLGSIELLLADRGTRDTLGSQAMEYSSTSFADPDRYVDRVGSWLAGIAGAGAARSATAV